MSNTLDKTVQIANILINPIGFIGNSLSESSKNMNKVTALDDLKEESLKQEIKMEFSKHQAKVAQELAIAKRIEDALEVEIEEYYDNSGKGGVDLNIQAGSAGLSAESARVSKRIYRFKGKSQIEKVINSKD